jgi:hypothetical protein
VSSIHSSAQHALKDVVGVVSGEPALETSEAVCEDDREMYGPNAASMYAKLPLSDTAPSQPSTHEYGSIQCPDGDLVFRTAAQLVEPAARQRPYTSRVLRASEGILGGPKQR